MIHSRRLGRAVALQVLFELESRTDRSLDDVLSERVECVQEEQRQELDPGLIAFIRRLVDGTLQYRTELDETIARVAPSIPVDQLPVTDRVALELALFELRYDRSAPVEVIINEAVQLAKTYGGENSGRFVNGVLGTIAEEPDIRALEDQTKRPGKPRAARKTQPR